MKFAALFSLLTILCCTLCAEAPKSAPWQGKHPGRPGMRNSQRDAAFWRVFSTLPQDEQKELMKLQRTEPEKFRSIMQEKAARLQAEYQARQQKIADLAAKIRNSKDDREKAALRTELRAMLKNSFNSRIAHLRRNIENNKKRIAKMEQELKKRETNADAIIDAITNDVIEGKSSWKRHPGHASSRKPHFPGK